MEGLALMSALLSIITGYQGWNHLYCMFTPLTGGTLIKFHRDLGGRFTSAWSVVFDLHRGMDLLLHLVFLYQFPYRVDHLLSTISHTCRYLGHPWSSYEAITILGKWKLEFYVDCLGQFLSMILWLGWPAATAALVAQVKKTC